MDVLINNFPAMLRGFGETLLLLLMSGVIALVLGTVLGTMRVSPIVVLRGVGTSYVNLVRNTPLLLILLIFLFGFPELGANLGVDLGFREFNNFYMSAVLGLGTYTAAFICEAIRSGVNSIPLGQAEAARSIGMTFNQAMRQVILPQSFRAVIPPLASIYIALAKNTSLAVAVGVTEAAFQMRKLVNDQTASLYWIFAGFSVGYMIIVWVIAGVAAFLERSGVGRR